MKAHYKTANGRLTFEVEGPDQKILFRQVAALQETFEAENSCGVCNSTNIRFQVRDVDDNDFYELVCKESLCRARFSFGQHKGKGGTLFPKRKDDSGDTPQLLPNRGWAKYVAPARNGQASSPRSNQEAHSRGN